MDVEQFIEGAVVTPRGTEWGDDPLWTVSNPAVDYSFDVGAPDEAGALNEVRAIYSRRDVAAAAESNETAIRAALEGRLDALATAKAALGNGGAMFADRSAQERALLRTLVQDDIALIRLALRRLEVAE